MATKYLLQNLEGETLDTKSKKQTLIDAAHKQSLPYFRVVTDKGSVVYEEAPETAPESPDEDLIGDSATEATDEPETLFYESIDFPGNYSIVMAPFAEEIAAAAGVPTKVETFKGKLVRRVHFGGVDMGLAQQAVAVVKEEAANALEVLHDWQKEHVADRKNLTDMQKYIQHREVLADHGHKVARQVKKNGLS